MSLRHGLLGLLDQEPATGYELTKAFEQLSQFAWHASHSHIYPELRKMTEAGLIEVVGEASRGRKTYGITETGRVELRRWILEPEDELIRSAAALRLFMVGSLEPAEARVFLQQYADQARRRLAGIEAQVALAGPEWHDNPLSFGRLAAERGRRTLPALLDWTEWGLAQLDDDVIK
ncbi:PadR family transcriptional regulator [Kribbella sp. NBC_01505]|uniref:PadR family transcriptional regulator n=1 Tax=Kribbella sp. NBC_01505 TaxID=2903580 RepID=UPI00386BF416